MKLVAVTSLMLLMAAAGHAAPVCSLAIADRYPCGWLGISQGECQSRGCCYEVSAKTLHWCYQSQASDPCKLNPCRSDELCVSTLNGATYTCTCPSGRASDGRCNAVLDSACAVDVNSRVSCGWWGITRDECLQEGCCFQQNAGTLFWCYKKKTDVNPCDSLPCRRDEVCVRNGQSYACTCPAGRAGTRCSTPTDSTCAISLANRKSCGWFGISQAQCAQLGCCYEVNAQTVFWCYSNTPNPCASTPCKNGGACSANGDSYTCSCPSTWTGADCGTPADPCGSKPCKNGGTCSASGSSFTCTCVPGWAGTDCTTDINVCLKSNPCKNGGTCVKFGESYECHCLPTWAGTNCELDSAACKAVAPENRINCGWGGVTADQCNERSCCYDPTVPGRPACYYAVPECDTMDSSVRATCGFPGISYNQCINRGCCFNDDDDNNVLCYRKANPACIGVKAEDRVARGYSTITPNECTAQGYCWESSAVPNCFVRKA